MDSPQFNLSVLENGTFSTPLKDRSDYDAILTLIKEEIDVSQTEDEGHDQSCPNNALHPRARRSDSEFHDYDSKFKSPYAMNHSAKTKSPGTLLSRTKRRSHDDFKNDTRKDAAERARTLGHVMPGRSHKSTARRHRSSGSYSDTSGFSDPVENGKTLNRKSLSPRKKFDDPTDPYETEGEALEELLTMAQEQVIVDGSPYGRNSTVSSQGESTSLATSDPLDTGAMEEECYVESSQPACVSDFRKKLLNLRSICGISKNVEMIKRNLHFSDAPESEEECQHFSLALSPEPTSLLNYDIDGITAPAAGRKRSASQDSIASILNSLTSSSSNFYSQREASTTPPRPRMRKSSQDSIARAFNSSTTNSYNSQNQKEASTTSLFSSMSKRSRESTPGIQNSPYDLHDLERKRQASTTPQPYTRQTSRESSPSTASTLNVIHDLEEFEPKREASTTPESGMRRTRQGSTRSTASTLNLLLDLQDLEPKREAITPQHSNTSEVSHDSPAIILRNLTPDLQDLDPERGASMRTTSQDSIASVLKNLIQDLPDLDSERETSTTLQLSNMSKTCQDSTPENPARDLPNFNPVNEASATLPSTSKRKTSRDSRYTLLKNLTEEFDLNNSASANETSVTPLCSRERKTSQGSTASSRTNLTREMQNLVPEREADAPPPQPGEPTKMSQNRIDRTSKSLTPNSSNSHNQRETSPTAQPSSQDSISNIQESITQDAQKLDAKGEAISVPPRSKHRKTSQGSIASSREDLTQELERLHFKREASATPPYPRHRRTSQNSIGSSQNSFPQELSNFDCAQDGGQVLPPRPRKRKISQASTVSSATGHTQDSSNVDSTKEASVTPPRPKKKKKKKFDIATTLEGLTQNPTNEDSAKDTSVTPLRPRHQKTSQDSTANSHESLNFDCKREPSATPPYPRQRRPSQNSVGSSRKNFTEELSNFDPAQDARVTPPRSRKRKTSQDSTDSSAQSPTQVPSNVDSTKEARVTPPRRKKKRKKKSDTATCLEGLTQDTPNNVTQDLTDVGRTELSMTPSHPRKRKMSVSPLKGLSQEFENCIMNVDFERLCEEINNDAESPSFTFETVQLLDDYDACNPAANNKILSKILASPISKTDEEAPRSVEHIGSSEDPLDYDPLYITEAEDTETASASTSKRKQNKGTKKVGIERKSLMVDESVKESKRRVDKYDTLEEGLRRSSRSRKTRVDLTMLDLEEEDDLSNKAARVSKKVKSSSKVSFDYVALDMAETEDNETATPSTSKGKKKTGTKNARNERKSLMVDESVTESKRTDDKDDTLEGGPQRSSGTKETRENMTISDWEEEDDFSDETAQVTTKVKSPSQDSLDYDALDITEDKDTETAAPSTSKKKAKTETKKKRIKRKSHPVDKSFQITRKSDKNDTLEEGARRSSRIRNRPVSTTVLDEDDLSEEAAAVAKKIKAAMKKERLSSETFDKLDNIEVQLRHKVLPQHDIEERAGTAPLTYEQQMQFLDFASLNKDVYSTEEDDIIKRNWNAFCVDHDWDPQNYKVFLQFKHGDRLIMSSVEQRRKFVQFLANGIPNRPLYSVYNRFKKIYSDYTDVGESYSLKEDKQLLAYILHNQNKKPETKFAELSKVLSRPRDSIWKRYKTLKLKETLNEKSKKVMRKVEWDLSLVTEFITNLLNVTISEDLSELKDAFIPIVVWRKLEEKIKIDHNFMKRSWDQQFHMQFFSPEPLSANAIKIKLIEYLWMKGIRDGINIEWHVVVKYFDGCTISFLRKTFNHLTSEAFMELKSRSLGDIMQWLHRIKIDRLRRRPIDHYLPRLRYVDKRVEIVPEDTTKVTLTGEKCVFR